MAKKKKKGTRRRSSRKSAPRRKTPKTLKGVWKEQPLLVKGGMAYTALEIGADKDYGGIALFTRVINAAQGKDSIDNVMNATKEAVTDLGNYKGIVIGVLAHKGAKMLGVKGL